MSALTQYFRESYKELVQKVSWPAWTKLESDAVKVILVTIFLSLLLYGIDKLLLLLLDLVY
jgi:preprotein translocase subunit SecE